MGISDGGDVSLSATGGLGADSLQSLTSDGATLAVQQVMLGGQSDDDSLDTDQEDADTGLSAGELRGLVLSGAGLQ
ncbi:hypothetical protein GDO81_020585 [Engystomops pustulosus]|uniref:Uncharacterized protein n=2 Tax=Engystomops pustulosus TaxID=76066 RepID=A0AAV6ZED7_ENGPU|nr:hypothetical protein GDO81_020585 [Engystomops pustulosus]